MRFLLFLFSISICRTLSAQDHTAHIHHKAAMSRPVVSAAHQALEESYDVRFHHLDLHVERNSTYISGSVRTVAQAVGGTLDTFGFELHPDMTIDSVIQIGQSLPVTRIGNEATALLASSVRSGDDVDVTIYYHGTAPHSTSFIGDNGLNSNMDSTTWSLSESFHAYEWWPCKQTLQDKIDSSWVFITTDTANKAGSNGLLTHTVQLGNGKVRYEWKSRHPIDYYLISIAVGRYQEYNNYAHPAGFSDSIFIQNYIYGSPGSLIRVRAQLDTIPAMIELFSRLYGLYPFADEKYGHCLVYSHGSCMEHQTMSTMGWFDFQTDAHELAHQWFGDNATCSTWNNIHMNEGFAAYSEYLAMEYLKDTATAQKYMRSVHSSVLSPAVGSLYFDGADTLDENVIFSNTVYCKGAAFNHMVRYIINNDSVFYRALQVYQQQFRASTASVLDFKAVIESVSGIDFTQFYAQWFYGIGYPTFDLTYNFQNGQLYLRSDESVSSIASTPLFITPVEYRILRTGAADTTIRVQHDQHSMSYAIPMTGTDVTGIITDPQNWILNKNGAVTRDDSLIVFDTVATGLNEGAADQSIYLYPNPAQASTGISGFKSGMTAIMYDGMGRTIPLDISHTGIIDVTSLASGVYQVKISGIGGQTLAILKLVRL